ncbi:MAG: rod shape-determining protein MreD [Gloeocapsa sp. UFS-A4-WI-NPMV-4B04]|jgi:rod shape-determining protein MreD|nr:rod shape-determining protein MreD [Gloeocapsa sp. UFS-A4-WI-NPMV-4B04]
MNRIPRWYPHQRQIVNWMVTVGSVLLCLIVLPMRLPGMELLGIAPNWLLIWVVAWSVKRTIVQGAIAGFVLGLLQDGMTSPYPTHTLSLVLVGILTARLHKQRYIQEDFISVAIIVFGMAMLAEAMTTLQFSFLSNSEAGINKFAVSNFVQLWKEHQRIALASAILSSLWAPVVYYPLNRWWQKMNVFEPS